MCLCVCVKSNICSVWYPGLLQCNDSTQVKQAEMTSDDSFWLGATNNKMFHRYITNINPAWLHIMTEPRNTCMSVTVVVQAFKNQYTIWKNWASLDCQEVMIQLILEVVFCSVVKEKSLYMPFSQCREELHWTAISLCYCSFTVLSTSSCFLRLFYIPHLTILQSLWLNSCSY